MRRISHPSSYVLTGRRFNNSRPRRGCSVVGRGCVAACIARRFLFPT
jgi:hypothetical protein